MYRLECNTCRCTRELSLLCTKMACIDWKSYMNRNGDTKVLRTGEKQKKSPYLSKLQKGALCKPGKLYRNKCKKCFCTDEHKILCATKNLTDTCTIDNKKGYLLSIKSPEDILPAVNPADIQKASTLSTAAQKCEPGKSYKVDCNFCVCMEDHNLLCQRKMCISYDDMHRLAAKEISGKACNGSDDSAVTTDDCKRCECVDGILECKAILHCYTEVEQLAHKNQQQKELDPTKDKCQPNAVYRSDCNKCYCQADGSLRCTQKTCLNYSQVKLLEKQRLYLEKHGL